jgi:hypothetical protein
MTPAPGDIYVVHNSRLDAYTAVQVTHVGGENRAGLLAVLTLDWLGKSLPDDAALDAMRPGSFDFMFWNAHRQHLWLQGPVPQRFQHVGRREPLVTADTQSFGGGWPDGDTHFLQRRWDAIDADVRARFKTAAREERHDKTVVLEAGGLALTRSTGRVNGKVLSALASLADLDALPLLTTVEADAPVPGLLPWLRTRPTINELILSGQDTPVIDLRGTNLGRVAIDMTGVREIHLNDGLDTLTLNGTASADLVVHGEDNGRWLTVNLQAVAPVWSGLPEVSSLNLHGVKSLDANDIVQAFPRLQDLRIWGAPGILQGLERLAALKSLSTLMLNDVFPPADAALPGPSAWPALAMLWLTSVPADLAAAAKKAYKAETARGLNLSVRQPRKPEWLAANLDNPFREWDGSEFVTSAQAKKAAMLYRKARTDALKLAADMATQAGPLADALRPVVLAYTEGFNAMDRRSSFIETVEREQIYMALMGIVDAVEAKRREVAGDGIDALDRARVEEAMDEVREF